ncbi:hypothetical protein F2Q70_00000903 [Brassica cretica]|uniref:Uncharacterized protein n=1 Tax=Brassica cretica TaxID=69181 RepID=A0A8S9J0D4_BRACR|nr:hypothetical protein F2Q70_00000903 [Brassica cretica]
MEFVSLHDELREELKEMARCREDQAAIRSKKMRKWKTEMGTAKKVNILLELDAQPGSAGLRYWVLESLGGSLADVGHSIPWLAFHVGVLFPMLTRSHKYRSGVGKFGSTKGSREVQPSLRRGVRSIASSLFLSEGP